MASILYKKSPHTLQQLLEALLALLQKGGDKMKSCFPKPAGITPPAFTPHQLRFKQAAAFASMVRSDDNWKRAYAKLVPGVSNVYLLAMRDALCGPQLSQLHLNRHLADPALHLRIRAVDNVGVARVLFQFTSTTGQVLEEGRGKPSGDGNEWCYTTCSRPADLLNCMATVTAFDLAGNKAVIHKTL